MQKNNGDKTIKILIYILSLLIFVLLMLLVVIIPSVKKYKSNKNEYNTLLMQNKHLKKKDEQLGSIFKKEKNASDLLLSKYSNDFDKDDFSVFAKKYFKDVNIKRVVKPNDKSIFKTYSFLATTKTDTLKEFYRFLDDTQKYKSIVKINFPISLKRENTHVVIRFNIDIYKN